MELPCDGCGVTVVKRKRPDRKTYCDDCALAAMIDAARQMSDKQGPMWEAWLASNADGAPGRSPDQEE